MGKCIWNCMREKLGFWAVVSLISFVVLLVITGGNVPLAAALAGVALAAGVITIAANCYLRCKKR